MSTDARRLIVTSWYVNTHRVLEVIGASDFARLLPFFHGHPLGKGALVSTMAPLVVEWIQRSNIRPLEEMLLGHKLRRGSIFTYEGKFFSKGLSLRDKNKLGGIVRLRRSLADLGEERELVIEFHQDGLTTSTAWGSLSGQPSVFVLAYVSTIDGQSVLARPFVIGDLLEEFGPHAIHSKFRYGLELRPEDFDALKEIDFHHRMKKSDLLPLRAVPEQSVKEAFAEILGEPHLPNDWGGETCDLFSSNILVEGRRRTCAFAFKGPAKFKPMEIKDCGKNGDQIVRLFDTPADLLVLQHCHEIRPPVRKMMAAFARGSLEPRRQYCIFDGYETLKVLKHFGRI